MTRKELEIPTFVLSCIFKISSTISDKSMFNSLTNKSITKESQIPTAIPGAACVQNKNTTKKC